MKKKIVLFTCLVAVLTAIGCGSKKTEADNTTSQTETVQESSAEAKTEINADRDKSESAEKTEAAAKSEEKDNTPEQSEEAKEVWATKTLGAEAAESLELFRQDLRGEKAFLGVAFIGWSGNYSECKIEDLLNGTKDIYRDEAFMGELDKCKYINQPGEEVYVLVPSSDKSIITVYEQIWGDATEDSMPARGRELYKAEAGEVVVVCGNQSDIVSNLWIELDTDGHMLTYQPSLSLDDGRLTVIDGVSDISRYDTSEY